MLEKFWRWFNGLVTIRQEPPYDKPPKKNWPWLMSAFRQVWPATVSMSIFAPLWGAADAMLPLLLGATFDKYINPSPNALSDGWYYICLSFLAGMTALEFKHSKHARVKA